MFDSLSIKKDMSALPKNNLKHRKTIMATQSFDVHEDETPFKFSF
jgi:hypothetical protein